MVINQAIVLLSQIGCEYTKNLIPGETFFADAGEMPETRSADTMCRRMVGTIGVEPMTS